MCHAFYRMYTKFQVHISKHVQKTWKTFHWRESMLSSPLWAFWPTEGQKLPYHDDNWYGSRQLLYKCVYRIWRLDIIFEAINGKKWLWPIFTMKLRLNVLHHLLNVYPKFQIDISKHVQKVSLVGALLGSPFWVFLTTRPWIQKNAFDLFLAVK